MPPMLFCHSGTIAALRKLMTVNNFWASGKHGKGNDAIERGSMSHVKIESVCPSMPSLCHGAAVDEVCFACDPADVLEVSKIEKHVAGHIHCHGVAVVNHCVCAMAWQFVRRATWPMPMPSLCHGAAVCFQFAMPSLCHGAACFQFVTWLNGLVQ